MPKNTICVWYDKEAEAAARFYAKTFPDSAVGAVHRAPSDYPSGKAGDVLTVEFTVAGVACVGLNGGPAFKPSEACSFMIATDDQAETDRYWNAMVGNAGLADNKVKTRIVELGGTVMGGTPAEFGTIIAEATEKWAKVIKFAGVKAE